MLYGVVIWIGTVAFRKFPAPTGNIYITYIWCIKNIHNCIEMMDLWLMKMLVSCISYGIFGIQGNGPFLRTSQVQQWCLHFKCQRCRRNLPGKVKTALWIDNENMYVDVVFAHVALSGAEEFIIFCALHAILHGIHTSHMSKPNVTRVQSPTQWTASVHTSHMSKPNVTRVQSATQWTASVHTLHMSKPNVTHVQSATQWTAAVHTLTHVQT